MGLELGGYKVVITSKAAQIMMRFAAERLKFEEQARVTTAVSFYETSLLAPSVVYYIRVDIARY